MMHPTVQTLVANPGRWHALVYHVYHHQDHQSDEPYRSGGLQQYFCIMFYIFIVVLFDGNKSTITTRIHNTLIVVGRYRLFTRDKKISDMVEPRLQSLYSLVVAAIDLPRQGLLSAKSRGWLSVWFWSWWRFLYVYLVQIRWFTLLW